MSSQLQASGSPQTISSVTVEVPFFATVKEKLDKNGQLCGHLELQAGRELCQCPCGNHRAQPNRPQAFAHFLPRQFPVARLFELCPLLKACCLLSAAWHAEFLQRVEYPFTCLTRNFILLEIGRWVCVGQLLRICTPVRVALCGQMTPFLEQALRELCHCLVL